MVNFEPSGRPSSRWGFNSLFPEPTAKPVITRYTIPCPWCRMHGFQLAAPTNDELWSEVREQTETYGCPKCGNLSDVTFPTGNTVIQVSRRHKYKGLETLIDSSTDL